MPDPDIPLEEQAIAPDAHAPPWRRRALWGGLAVLLAASVVVFVRAPRAVDSQAAMGQGLPSTALGQEVEPGLEALAVQFVPEGFALASEESDGVDRVVQRYVGGDRVIVVTSVLGSFDPERALAADEDAEAVEVGGDAGIVQRRINEATGAEELVVRRPVGEDFNVIVRGVGGVPLDDLLAVAASVEPPQS